jgi:hypothetical protein
MFNIGDKLTKENYTQGAIWCNENNAMIEVIDGEYVIVAIPEPLPPTKEEIQALRSEAYKAEVDPITCHIQRLGDEEQTPEIIAEIANLVAERKAKVAEIKARYPYPAEPIEEIEELPIVEEAIVSEMEKVDIVD